MENRDDRMHVETDAARGGSTPNVMRWVLGISLLAAIVLLSFVWMTGAATHDGDGDTPTATTRVEAGANGSTSTDGLVNEGTDQFQNTPETGNVDANRVAN